LAPYRPPGWLCPKREGTVSFFQGEDQRLLTVFVGTNLIVHDVAARRNLHEWPLPFVPKRCYLWPSGQVELTDANDQVWTFDPLEGRMRGQSTPRASRLTTKKGFSTERGRREMVVASDHSVQLVDAQGGALRTLIPAPGAATMTFDLEL